MKRNHRSQWSTKLILLVALSLVPAAVHAQGTVEIDSGAAHPTNCIPKSNKGLFYQNTGANIGLWECTALNVWTFRGAISFGGTLTPTALSGDVNNYSPTGLASAFALRINGGAADRNITGLATGVDGRLVEIINIGSTNKLTLVNQSGLSSAANRVLANADLLIPVNSSMLLRYDGATGRWRPLTNAVGTHVAIGKAAVVNGDAFNVGYDFTSILQIAELFANDPNIDTYGMWLDISNSPIADGAFISASNHMSTIAADSTHSIVNNDALITSATNRGSGTVNNMRGVYGQIQNFGSQVDSAISVYASFANLGASAHVVNGAGFWAPTITNSSGGLVDTYYSFYSGEQTGKATNAYFLWNDSAGVFRVKADGVMAYYNPTFTKYTPGAMNFERIVQQWNTNVAELGPEAGGTGVLRSLRLIGAGVSTVGGFTAPSFNTATNCADSAGAAACGSAAAGSVVIDAGATSVVVSSTAVTANSQIFAQFDSSLGTRLGITCNTTVALPSITARTAGTSFTITVPAAPTTNPACYSYSIVN